MKLLIFTLIALLQLAQSCIVTFEGIFTPWNGHMTGKVSSGNHPVCHLDEFIRSKRDPYWLNCEDNKYAWISQDGSRFAYAANGVDYHGVPTRTPMNDEDNNIKLYWDACPMWQWDAYAFSTYEQSRDDSFGLKNVCGRLQHRNTDAVWWRLEHIYFISKMETEIFDCSAEWSASILFP